MELTRWIEQGLLFRVQQWKSGDRVVTLSKKGGNMKVLCSLSHTCRVVLVSIMMFNYMVPVHYSIWQLIWKHKELTHTAQERRRLNSAKVNTAQMVEMLWCCNRLCCSNHPELDTAAIRIWRHFHWSAFVTMAVYKLNERWAKISPRVQAPFS